MTNDQVTALLIAAVIGLISNMILKYMDKHKSKEEVADLGVDTLTQVLDEMRKYTELLKIDNLFLKNEVINLKNEIVELKKEILRLTVIVVK